MIRSFMVLIALSLPAVAQTPEKQPPCEQVASIGVATMASDGTITLRVRSLPPGPIGEGILDYPPSHPRYRAIVEHLGGLAPGESKPVVPIGNQIRTYW